MRPFVLALGFALALGVGSSASAQDAVSSSLPEWAAPSAPYEAPDVDAMSAPPDPPATPDQVPLDGGLGLLALAGGAYAAKKLRERASE